MNPNSANQRWSLWEYRIFPSGLKRPSYQTVKANAARFGRLAFGSASEMRVQWRTDDFGRLCWVITVLSEDHPVHDATYVEWMHRQWHRFFTEGFGPGSTIQSHARLMAGDREDGRPADQLIVLPGISVADAAERA
jgi:hypothetical protein